jgi:hypothetical protein
VSAEVFTAEAKSFTMSGIMLQRAKPRLTHNQLGSLNTLLIPFIFAVLLLIAAASFGFWAFSSRQDYKNNTDQKVAVAVTAAKQQQEAADAATYAQQEKDPLRTYVGPAAYGSLNVLYPKTWSAYVSTASTTGSATPVNGYFEPATVPDVTSQASVYALRVEVTQTAYSQVLATFNGLAQQGLVTVTPYSLPKVPSVVGVRIDGAIEQNKQGSMIILPLRANTLQIWTESSAEESDLNTIILPNLSFSP